MCLCLPRGSVSDLGVREDVKKAKMLEVPREQYLRCARLRAQVCDAFVDVETSAARAAEILPEQGVPEAFVDAALEFLEAEQFQPTMVGPASIRVPGALQEDQVQAEAESDREQLEAESDSQAGRGSVSVHVQVFSSTRSA